MRISAEDHLSGVSIGFRDKLVTNPFSYITNLCPTLFGKLAKGDVVIGELP
jgi:hypothetical protein